MPAPIPPHELEHNGPPWKAVQINGTWCVTTDRGNPAEEFDVNESGYEWVVKLEAAAPALLAACERICQWVDESFSVDEVSGRQLMTGVRAMTEVRTAIKLAQEGKS